MNTSQRPHGIFTFLCCLFITLSTIGGGLFGWMYSGGHQTVRMLAMALIALAVSSGIVWFITFRMDNYDSTPFNY